MNNSSETVYKWQILSFLSKFSISFIEIFYLMDTVDKESNPPPPPPQKKKKKKNNYKKQNSKQRKNKSVCCHNQTNIYD